MSRTHIVEKSVKLKQAQEWPPEFGTARHPVDPGGPVGRPWEADRLPGESDMQAVFRRYPIDSHKPGPA